MLIAVIGANGFVGSALCAALGRAGHDVVCVVRETYEQARCSGPFDMVINAAMPSKRFWAREHPDQDFVETVGKTFAILHGWNAGKFVQISSVSARSQLHTVYGQHKAAAEMLCNDAENLIVRLGPMYGEGLSKGVLIDMAADRTVHVAGESRYGFAPVRWVAENIADNLHLCGQIEIGARDAIALKDVASAIGSNSDFQGEADHQEFSAAWPDAPSAWDVVEYAKKLRQSLHAQANS